MKANPSYRWDWPVAVLLVAAIFTSAVRLDTTGWTPDLGNVEILALIGTILGLALGVSQFKPAAVRWLVIGYSLIIVPAQLCRLVIDEKTVLGQLASIGGRLIASISILYSGKAIEDHVFFVTLMCILFWAVGLYSGYRLMRRPGIFAVLLPSTLPILIIQYYDGYKTNRIWGLAFYFFLALLITGRINLIKSRERWDEERVLAGSDPEFDLSKNLAIAAATIILIAWMLPAPAAVLPAAARAWRSFSEPFETTRQYFNNMLAALNGQSTTNTNGELYGVEMGLGRSAGNGEVELFRVHAPSNSLPRLYWRVRVYDQYRNGSWQATNNQNTLFEPDQGSLIRQDGNPAPTGEFIFTWQTNQSALLATPSLPVWVSRKGSIQVANDNSPSADLLSWSVLSKLQPGDQYQVRAILLSPTRKELRNSVDAYPDWVKERYLQIPADLSATFKNQAEQITSGKTTTFDKVEAVTEYLRQNITYAETIPAPPPGVDAVNWFLFSWKSGFCNYYASAEVLLLRSLGIPARMVAGYAQGKAGDYGNYTVLGQDAHAWPEVYFTGIGWVEFEPTVNQQALIRPSGDNTLGSSNSQRPYLIDGEQNLPTGGHEPIDPAELARTQQKSFLGLTLEGWLWVIILVDLLALSGMRIWRLERRQPFAQRVPRTVKSIYIRFRLRIPAWLDNWVRWSDASSIERAFHGVNQALTWLQKPQPDYATPAERADVLKKLLPEASEDIELLTSALEQTLYTPLAANPAGIAGSSWRIRLIALRKIVFGRFTEINK